MNRESETLAATLELVRAADPLDYAEGEQPDTEAALRVMLATVPASRSRRAPQRRRVLSLAGAGAGATIAADDQQHGGVSVRGIPRERADGIVFAGSYGHQAVPLLVISLTASLMARTISSGLWSAGITAMRTAVSSMSASWRAKPRHSSRT